MAVMPLDTKLTKIGLPPSVYVPLGLARGLRSFPRPETLADVLGSPAPAAWARSAASGVPDRADRTAARRRRHPLSGPPR